MPFAGEDPHFLTLLCRGVLGDRGPVLVAADKPAEGEGE